MQHQLKDKDALAHEIGLRVIEDANLLRLYMDETFAAKFPIVWAGQRFKITIEMEQGDDRRTHDDPNRQ